MSESVAAMMRVSQYARYGKPEVLHEATAAVPTPGPGHVLIRVHGTSVNPLDTRIRRGGVRLATGFSFPKGTGMDFAGEVVSVGEGVDGVVAGKRVWGFLPGLPAGPTLAAAEYLVTTTASLSAAPQSIELLDASALPLTASTALMALREHTHLRPGERLLVRGAGGGVGTAAIQLAVAMGAEVTALTGAGSLELVRRLGAHAALDYRTHGPSQVGRFDVILDLTGRDLPAYRRLLTRHGRMITTAVSGAFTVATSVVFGPKRVRTLAISPRPAVLATLAGFVDRGVLTPVIDAIHPLAEAAAAHAAVEAGGSRGKHVIDVRS